MSDDIPQAANLDSHSPFSSGSLPCCECNDADAACPDVAELRNKLQFLLDTPLAECLSALEVRGPSYAPLDVLRDICSLTSALTADRTTDPSAHLPAIIKLLRCFLLIAEAGSDATGLPVDAGQSALLLADVYFLLANSLWKLHGCTEPVDGFGWATQGAQPDSSKVEEADRLMQMARNLHVEAQRKWGFSGSQLPRRCGAEACFDLPRRRPCSRGARPIPANLVPASRIMTCAALIAKARQGHSASVDLLKQVAAMEPWIPEYELRPSAVQASHRQSVTFAHLCLVRHYTDAGNFSSAMYHSKTAIAAKMHYERDVRGLHEWEVDALWEPEASYALQYTPPRPCELPPGMSDQQHVDELCRQAAETASCVSLLHSD